MSGLKRPSSVDTLQADSDVAHVVRALLAEMQADEGLADRVRARLNQ